MNAVNSAYINCGGLIVQSTQQRSASGQIGHEVTLAAAKAGTLTTRTDDDTGVITLAGGHGLLQNDVVDVYWAAGLRYGMTVTNVDGALVTVDLGAGDVLPAQSTAVVVGKVTAVDTDFDGDLVAMIAAQSTYRGHVAFRDAAENVLKAVELAANEAWLWASDTDIANPLAGDPVDNVRVSNGDSANAATLKLGILYDSES